MLAGHRKREREAVEDLLPLGHDHVGRSPPDRPRVDEWDDRRDQDDEGQVVEEREQDVGDRRDGRDLREVRERAEAGG